MGTFIASLIAVLIGLWLLKLGWAIFIAGLGVMFGKYVWDEDEQKFVER